MTVHSMLDIKILSQLASDHEARLRRAGSVSAGVRSSRHIRRWFGLHLVRLGAWVAAEPTIRPVPVR